MKAKYVIFIVFLFFGGGVWLGADVTKYRVAHNMMECTIIELHDSSARICYDPRKNEGAP